MTSEKPASMSKVLLVDDEVEFTDTLSERLRIRDFDTSVVHDGAQALAAIEQDEPDVMILDLKMPGIDGIEVLRRLKKTKPRIEVIVLTGHGSDRDRELALELGAFAYLEKPVNLRKLTSVLQDAVSRRRQKREA